MKEGGEGGANTLSGLKFEGRADLIASFQNLKGYKVVERKTENNIWHQLFFKDKEVARVYKKYSFYKIFLEEYQVDWKKHLSTQLLPDQALFIIQTNRLYIIEMKFQQKSGSVDEKLQTCEYKRQQYQRLVMETGIKVEYCYILNEWFDQSKYDDVKEFIKLAGCDYFIKNLPFKILGLPEPEVD
ncbi:hypothetical protein HZA98_04175 [Candidatus Woesearchaeota archaeon]|nr:hypothetical protein [Candidatus Woesearchaeota archaeon]